MMSMSNLAQLYQEIEDITSYKQIVDTIAEFFKKLEPDEAKIAAYLSLGSTGPKFEDTDMGLGNKFCLQAIAEAYDAGKDKVQKIFDEKGDLGDTAAYFCKRKKSSLSVKEVFDRLVKIRDFSGEGSRQKKIGGLAKLLADATFREAGYIVRIAVGKLRLGFGEQFLIEALAKAFTGHEKGAKIIEDKYNINTDIGAVRNKSKNRFETFTKVGSGFTDQDFKEIEEKLVRADKKPVDLFVDEHMEPDEYVEPDMVIEVLGAEITTSPKHTAGRGKSNKGFALRFPRFLHIRDDKATDQATTVEEILELKQAEKKRN
jgi:ATP-dependent DNA ligase